MIFGLPGWGTTSDIYNGLQASIIGPKIITNHTQQACTCDILNQPTPITLIGYSLGGFLAAAIAAKYPDKIQSCVLISICEKYDPLVLDQMIHQLKKNKSRQLREFYKACTPTSEQEEFFNSNKKWETELSTKSLIDGLNLLKTQKLQPKDLKKNHNLTIIHGKHDQIAPLKSAKIIAEESNAKWIEIPTGHYPFTNKQATEIIKKTLCQL